MFKDVLKDFIDEQCGGSQKVLSDGIGMPAATINKWYNGLTEPNCRQLIKLADFFGCTTDELLGREPHAGTAVDKRPELRPSTLKLVDATTKLNDLGIAAVIGYVARLIEEHPDFVLPQYQRK